MQNLDLIKTGEVLTLVPFSRPVLNKLVSNGEFPQPIRISERLNLWSKSEVTQWLDSKFGGVEHG